MIIGVYCMPDTVLSTGDATMNKPQLQLHRLEVGFQQENRGVQEGMWWVLGKWTWGELWGQVGGRQSPG